METRTRTANPSPCADSAAANWRKLLFSLVPVFVPAALCLVAATQRAVSAAVSDRPFGRLSGAEARRTASDYCSRITGESASVGEASKQKAFSHRRQLMVREWDVTCSATGGEYLLRINANTGQIFGVNRLSAAGEDVPPESWCSRATAESRARGYLGMLGVPMGELQPVGERAGTRSENGVASWCFTYRLDVPGVGRRLLSVSVDAVTGSLVCAWTPALAF